MLIVLISIIIHCFLLCSILYRLCCLPGLRSLADSYMITNLPEETPGKLDAFVIFVMRDTSDIIYTIGMDDFKRITNVPEIDNKNIDYGGTHITP
jgi:hypothetical protein